MEIVNERLRAFLFNFDISNCFIAHFEKMFLLVNLEFIPKMITIS